MTVFYDERPDETENEKQIFVRQFPEDVAESELIWHRDKKDRRIRIISGVDWQLQLDNDLPVTMNIGDVFQIPKMLHHRLIRGKGKLIIEIEEND